MHDPGHDQWAGLSCNIGESEGAVAPEMEHSPETADGPEREAHTPAQSAPELSQHSGTAQQLRRL
jgi:hypothetical protein